MATFYNSSTDGFGILGLSHQQQIIVVAFKGTDPRYIEDLIIDSKNILEFPHVCTLTNISGRAHEGFCLQYNSLKYEGVFDALVSTKNQYPNYQVVVTGHSLGAAVAMLFSLDLMSSQDISVSLYTFGQPRTVASELATAHYDLMGSLESSEMFRVTHFKDMIPHLPKCKANSHGICEKDNLHGYHSGYQIHYDETMNRFQKCTPIDGADCNEFLPVGVEDHLYYFGVRISTVCCPASLVAFPSVQNADSAAKMPLENEGLVDEAVWKNIHEAVETAWI